MEVINTEVGVIVTLWRQEAECGRLQRVQAQVGHAVVFKRNKVTGGFFTSSFLTGNVTRGKALATKTDDPSAIPGTHEAEEH